jgi:DNA-binding CsgD family transcriptional regulator
VALLERDAELEALGAAVEEATLGAGRTIVVEGPAGAGKSALLAAAAAEADHGARVLRATGSELEREYAFGAIRQLFEPLLVAATEETRHRLLAGSAAPAAWVVDSSSAPDSSRGRAEAGFAVLQAIYWLAANAATDAPLLLAVDDLHWLDESSLQALAFLARRLDELPVGLLVTVRPSELDAPAELIDAIRTVPGATRVSLPPLSREGVAETVRQRLPDAGDDLCSAFHEASAGNPLYLHELLLSVTASGAVTADVVRTAAIPTLAERLARRIARVDPQAQALAAAMAVLGDGGSLQIAAELAALDHETSAAIARRLTDIEVLSRDDPIVFAHPVLRRSVHDRLSAREREALHAGAARLLRAAGARPEAIATHVSALAPAASSAVAQTLLDAARAATARAAPKTAARLLRRALEEEAKAPPRVVLLHELGRVELASRDPASLTDLRAAFELADDPRLRARVAVDLAELLAALGQWQDSVQVMGAAVAELGASEPEVRVELECIRAAVTAYDPRFTEEFESRWAHYEELTKEDAWASHALAGLLAGVAGARCEDPSRSRVLLERALDGGRVIREQGGGHVAFHLIMAAVFMGDWERALDLSDEIAAAGRRDGFMMATISGIGGRGLVHSKMGDLAAAEADLRTVVDQITQTGMTMWLTSAIQVFAETLLERPQLADVVAMVDAIELDPVFAETGGGAILLETRGRLALARGERAKGLEDLRAAGATLGRLKFGPTWVRWRSALAEELAADDPEYAERLIAEELELARASGVAEVEGQSLRAAGNVAGGERGIELLRQSVALLEGSPARLEHARSLVDLGAALRHAGCSDEARAVLESGIDLADRCGADRLVTRAYEELQATGARPRRFARSGVRALTASELRVARLAADGRSNLEIAQALFVSPKTVETHLSNAYAKLGLSGRGARGLLAGALESAG